MNILTQFDIKQTVYVRTDPEQLERIITEINIKPNNLILYEASCNNYATWFYDFELSSEKNVLKTMT